MGYLQERRKKFQLDDESPKLPIVNIECGIFLITNSNGYSRNLNVEPSSKNVINAINGNTKFGALYHGLGVQLQSKLSNEFCNRPLCEETLNEIGMMVQAWYENAKATHVSLIAMEDAISYLHKSSTGEE